MKVPRLEETDQGLTVFYNRYLYSKHNPARTPITIAKNVPVIAQCLYIVTSPLLGYGIKELLGRIGADSHIIALEVSQELFHLCSPHINDEIASHPSLTMVRLSNENSLQLVLEKTGLSNFRKVYRVDLNAGASLNPDIYTRLFYFVENALKTYWQNRHTLNQMGHHWVKHAYANLVNLTDGEEHQIQITVTKPILIAGAGPSLDEATDFILQHKDKVTLWALDTALGALLERDIHPDAVCVLETQSWNHLDFHGSAGHGISILADITSYPCSLQHTGGAIAHFTTQFAKLKFLDRMVQFGLKFPQIPPLGSVGLSAVHLAINCSDVPILTAGLDFAYSPGKTHGRGTAVHTWQIANISRTNPVPGWAATMQRPRFQAKGLGGKPIKTDTILNGYAQIFRDQFGHCDRLFAISGGLDIGIPSISQEEAQRLIDDHQNQTDHSMSTVDFHHDTRRSAKDFIQNELELLQSVVDGWKEYRNGKITAKTMCSYLTDLDQVYCDFPDQPPLPNTNDSFLIRAVSRCGQLIRYIQSVKSG